MESTNLFAIVDIETTGTNQQTDKIIQFACVIIENQQIVNQLSIDINPLRSIPKHITELTGISNKDVANSPYFEDVAFTIKQLLDGCVFVAHNVFFDFNFLNSELVRAGVSPLTSPCIDTVELFQVLFPTSNGFRVSDMASEMSIEHTNPHQALSDAYVTAQGFIKMLNKLRTLPLVTKETLQLLSVSLGVNNQAIFSMVLNEAYETKQNDLEGIVVLDGIAIKKKDRAYRYQDREVAQSFSSKLNILRNTQREMAEDIHQFLTKDNKSKNLFIEAETGTGKTMGYLYPLTFETKPEQKLISTSTILLQNQIEYQDIPLLNDLVKTSKQGVVVKSTSHYLSLHAFRQTLDLPLGQKSYAICQMAILVWLLETNTGDLDEVNVIKNNVFYQQVQHTGQKELVESSIFFEEDFYHYLTDRCQFADFIIVNHSFLFSDSQKKERFLPDFETVVIDEAHQLPNLIETISTKQLSLSSFEFELNHLIEVSMMIGETHDKHQKNTLMMSDICKELRESIDWLEESMVTYFDLFHKKEEQLIDVQAFFKQVPVVKRYIQQINVMLRELSELSQNLKLEKKKELSLNEKEFFHTVEHVIEMYQLFKSFFYDYDETLVKWISAKKKHVILSMINFSDLSINQYNWYTQAKKIIYTSGSLQLDNDSNFLERKLGLEDVQKKTLPSVFDYKNQACLFLLNDVNYHSIKSTNDFSIRISQSVKKLFETHEQTMLVLFTSHQLLEAVHKQLTDYFNQRDVLVLAQGISGTKEKILKKINQGNKCIILGANSFWEGMDFSHQSIDIVVMTKLPFDPPNRPIVQARYQYIEQQGGNPFYEDALPQAGIKLRQGIGRLLRSPEDRGILVLLDDRLVNSRYSDILCSYLPQALSIQTVTLPELLKESKLFLEKRV